MSYKIIILKNPEKLIHKKCDKHLKMRLFKKLLKLENTPRSYAKPLRSPLDGIWEIYFERRWRILFEIDEENKLIKIVAFKHKDEMK